MLDITDRSTEYQTRTKIRATRLAILSLGYREVRDETLRQGKMNSPLANRSWKSTYISRVRNAPPLDGLRDRHVFGYRASSVKSCLIPRSGWKEEGLPDSYVINEKTCRVTAAST